LRIAATFLLTCIAWVVFRAKTLGDAAYVYTHWFSGWDWSVVKTEHFQLKYFPAAIGGVLLLETVEVLRPRLMLPIAWSGWPIAVRWPAYIGVAFLILLFGVYRSNQFIYFQF
jgi:alginate O-acetyltransferase complex protein AlgI